MKQYDIRDVRELDREGGHFSRHMAAMTDEGLHAKADIAAELAYRDAMLEAWAKVAKSNRELAAEWMQKCEESAHVTREGTAIYISEDTPETDDAAGYAALEWSEIKSTGQLVHPDDVAVDQFAKTMKTKLAEARARGRGGWDDPKECSGEMLAQMLVEHLSKGNAGNLLDIANLAMMLHQRGEDPEVIAINFAEGWEAVNTSPDATSLDRRDARMKAKALDKLHRTLSGWCIGYEVIPPDTFLVWIVNAAAEYRRQAEGGDDDGRE